MNLGYFRSNCIPNCGFSTIFLVNEKSKWIFLKALLYAAFSIKIFFFIL